MNGHGTNAAEHPWTIAGPVRLSRKTFLPLGIVLASAVAALAGCEKKAAPAAGPPPPLPVTVLAPQPTDVPLRGEWVGTLDGFVNAQIQPQVSGYLVRQTYREGLPVSKGQVLFEIDPRALQATVAQAEGQLAQSKGQLGQSKGQLAETQAQFALTQINVNRDQPLADARAIAHSTLDNELQQRAQAEAAVHAAEANVASGQASIATAQAQVDAARLNLGFTHVRSLISGVAGQASTQVGSLVSPQSVLTSVSQLDPIKVYFSVSDSEYLTLAQRARTGSADLLRGASSIPLTLTLSNGEPYASKGRIAFVDRSMNAQTGAIRVVATFPNPGNVLRPGQFGRVSAETEVRRNVLLVPQSAVQELQGVQQVLTVGPGNKVHVLNVTLGPQFGSSWIIANGLTPGTQIILDNLQKLREGSPVSPTPAPPAALASGTAQAANAQPAGR